MFVGGIILDDSTFSSISTNFVPEPCECQLHHNHVRIWQCSANISCQPIQHVPANTFTFGVRDILGVVIDVSSKFLHSCNVLILLEHGFS